ncbi:Monoacylglycerol lipase ABHD12 [Nosema granulosis]|uniref:Monoacylglycerol lipase ABHD12 n=1 Tax=Nosema granulosis TaxID=83296 RepID=A0A9P6KZH3_9MICR|nr:Monoacylglycerol lipase ABHD12 [Nosema granulosis]
MFYDHFSSLVKNIILNIQRSKQPKEYFENNSYNNIYLTTRDGLKIGVSLFLPSSVDDSTQFVVFMHGVGCNRDDMSEIGEFKYFSRRNVVLLIPDYRGFGDSEGNFNLQGVNLDILSCFEYIFSKFGPRKVNIISFSLGTAIGAEYVKFVRNGSLTNGSLMNGSLMNGSPTNGSLMNGSLMNGSLMNGSLMNCSLMNGSLMNGSLTNDINDIFMPDKIILISPFSTLKNVLNSFKIFKVCSFLIPPLKKVIDKELYYDTLSNLSAINKDRIFVFHGVYDKLIPLEESIKIRDKHHCYFKSVQSDHIRILLNAELWDEINGILFKE